MARNPNFSEEPGYVDIHGRDVRVLVCEKTGTILIPIDELKGMGFSIYRKSQYNKLLIDDNQFNQEFNLFMLQCAQTYMLQNKIAFKEKEILESIDNCKKALTEDPIETKDKSPPKKFLKNHVIMENGVMNATEHQIETKPESPSSNFMGKSGGVNVTNTLRQPSAITVQNINTHNERKFKTPSQKSSPASSVHSMEQNSNENNSFEQRKSSNFKRNSFEHKQNLNSSFEHKKSGNFSQNNSKALNSNENEVLKKLPCVELNKPQHNVMISFVEKPNCAWVQDVDNVDALLNIDKRIKEEIANLALATKYALNKVYLAAEDDLWFRCKIIKFKPLTVFFLDYGNTSQVTELKEIPEDLAKIPGQAVRMMFQESYNAELYENVTVQIKKRYDNGTYVVDIVKNTKPTVTEKVIPTYFTKPRPLSDLEHGQRVMIMNEIDGKLVLRTKEGYEKLRQIEKAIEGVTVEPVRSVTNGQLVLCNKNNKLHRGQVLKVEGATAEIELLDYYDKLDVDLSEIKHINESLSLEPVTYIVTPAIIELKEKSARKIVSELIEMRAKSTVVLDNNGFDLKLSDGLLSKKLKPQEQPSNRTLLSNMKKYEPELGVGPFMVYSYRDLDNVTLVAGDALEEYLSDMIKSELEDTEPYSPVAGEVCFGLYQDNWFRCVIKRVLNNRYEVQFIDFGNLEFLRAEQLRKLTDDVKETPVLGIPCKFVGVPSIKNIEELLKQHINDAEVYEVNIKSYNGSLYEIEIPSLYNTIKENSV